jgi:hypothetical protein
MEQTAVSRSAAAGCADGHHGRVGQERPEPGQCPTRASTDLSTLVTFLEGTVSSDLDDPAAPQGEAEDRGEAFITAAVLDVPDHEPTLRMINCGYPPPLLLRGGQVGLLEVRHPAPPLGLTEFVETELFPETFAFEPGDIVLLYTDGVIEARDRNGTFYPLAERVAGKSGKSLDTLLAHLCKDLLRHVGGCLDDDAARVAIQRMPGSS